MPRHLENLYYADIDDITARNRPLSYIRRWIRIIKLGKKIEKEIRKSQVNGTEDIRKYLEQDGIQLKADARTINVLYRRKTRHETKQKRRRKRLQPHSQDITDYFRLHKRKKYSVDNNTHKGPYIP